MSILDILNKGKASLESEEVLTTVPEISDVVEVEDTLAEEEPVVEPEPIAEPLPVEEQVSAVQAEVAVAEAKETEAQELVEVERDLNEVDQVSTAIESLLHIHHGLESLIKDSPETAPTAVIAMEGAVHTIYRQLGMSETYAIESYALESAAEDLENKDGNNAKSFLKSVGEKIKAFIEYLKGLLKSLAERITSLFKRNKDVANKVKERSERLSEILANSEKAELTGKPVTIKALSAKDKMSFDDMRKGVDQLSNLNGWLKNNLTANVLAVAKAPFRKEFAMALAKDSNAAVRSLISTPSVKEVLGSKWVGLGADDLEVSKVFEYFSGSTEVAAASDKKQLEALIRKTIKVSNDVVDNADDTASKVDTALDMFTKAGEAEVEKAAKNFSDKDKVEEEMQAAMAVIRSTTTTLRAALVGLAEVNTKVICNGLDKVNQYVYGSLKV